ncbi:beta-ketoacyl synthase, partial [Spongiactinospora gelatinilytica]
MMIENAVAVVGMSCRFPGAADTAEFWANLRAGRDTISRFTDRELRAAGVDPRADGSGRVPAGGTVPGGETFDWRYFGYSLGEAATIDPQQRVFLECSAAALDDAGIDPHCYKGWIGVFAGCDLASWELDIDAADPTGQIIGREKDFLATRVAYKLGLRGPAITLQTACSTSLVAVHEARLKLLGHECDVALAGGVSLRLPQTGGYRYTEGGILSPDGHCRPFDAAAAGTVPSGGVGVVVLRRLEDALADGDRITAVLRGAAVNNDGADKPGYTTPSIWGQRDVIRFAHQDAGVEPGEIGYVEAHGTGTRVGDPIEIAALTAAFGDDAGTCRLGAVKSNIGHTGAAAGVAGLIKTVLQLTHGELVPTAHFRQANPEIRLESTPFRICRDHEPWRSEGPRLAGVSSFGIGGTNAHVVLQEAPAVRRGAQPDRPRIFPVSAADPDALARLRTALAGRVTDEADAPPLGDVAFTLTEGRRTLPHRLAVLAEDRAGLAAALRDGTGAQATDEPGAILAFPGQGVLHQGAGRAADLLLPEFRTSFDEISELVAGRFGVDLGALLAGSAPLTDTVFAQLAQFALGYALGAQVRAWGVRPVAMIGNSVGEYVAAALAGVWELPDALSVIHGRGRAMRAAPHGRMLAIPRRHADLCEGLEGVTVAVDAPHQLVLSGPVERIEALHESWRARGVSGKLLETAHAFHSPLMDRAADELREAVAAVPARPPRVPFVSNLTGTWVGDDQVGDPDYWTAHLLGTVRLTEGLAAVLSRDDADLLIELGPGSSTIRAARRHALWNERRTALPSLGRSADTERADVLRLTAGLWERGAEVGLAALLDPEGRRCALPAYPFAPLRCDR